MSRISQTFAILKANGDKALIPYISCGDPSLEFTEKLACSLEKAGADLLELGVPYSDPVADGPTIQKASQRALAQGVTLEKIFHLATRLRTQIKIPQILMTYYNPIYCYGLEKFAADASRAGVDGIIVPDLPLEEAGAFKKYTDAYNLDLIFIVAPTTTAERLERIAAAARGFLYCISVLGVTGSRGELPKSLEEFMTGIRSYTELPLAVGFGVSTPEMARRVAQTADGVIVGSSLIERIEKNMPVIPKEPEKVIGEISSYLNNLKYGMTLDRKI